MASSDILTSGLLSYIDHSAYPETEEVASANLNATTLQSISQALRQEQESVNSAIRGISKDASSDIDTWISRAKELQTDILRSRETARRIVAEAEAGRELKAKAEDRKNKVRLLEQEVQFQEDVTARLEHIKDANAVLGDVQDMIVAGDFTQGWQILETANKSIGGLGPIEGGSGVQILLDRRVNSLRNRLKEALTTRWSEELVVDLDAGSVQINDGVAGLFGPAQDLGIADELVKKFVKDFDRAILRPRMIPGRDGNVLTVEASGKTITRRDTTEEATASDVIASLLTMSQVVAGNVPETVTESLSKYLMPIITERLEERWLEPAVPTELDEMPAFEDLLKEVNNFADEVDRHRWHGSQPLRDWVEGAPRVWLTKRREAVLGDVRNLVFAGLKDQKTVERVETQMVSQDDALHGEGGGDDDWDNAWDEPAEAATSAAHPTQTPEDDDEASAWDVPDDDEPPRSETHEEDEGEAWGWGDGDEPSSPQVAKKEPPKINGEPATSKTEERELILRETFTVTGVPDGVLEIIQQVIIDAQTLVGPNFATSPIAPSSSALYSLPTLALAMYRATAPTAYSRLENGNMLIYNDARRLSDQLRKWQAEQTPGSRLRLDNDVEALDQFANRAYGAEMDAQRTILRDFLDGAQGFNGCSKQPFKDECESAVDQVVFRLRAVHKQWAPILSQSTLLQATGSLLSSVTTKMITEIEDLPDISEEDSKELKTLCDRVSAVRDLFLQHDERWAEARDATFVYCPSWLQFQYLSEIMDSSLADIKYLWKEGELSLEFTAEEIVGLVEALFAESGLRRQAIQDIRRGGR